MPADEVELRKDDAVNIAQVPTPQLQFVTRHVPVPGKDYAQGVRILQQRWSTVEHLNGLPTGIRSYEWRDVPLVEEG